MVFSLAVLAVRWLEVPAQRIYAALVEASRGLGRDAEDACCPLPVEVQVVAEGDRAALLVRKGSGELRSALARQKDFVGIWLQPVAGVKQALNCLRLVWCRSGRAFEVADRVVSRYLQQPRAEGVRHPVAANPRKHARKDLLGYVLRTIAPAKQPDELRADEGSMATVERPLRFGVPGLEASP